MIRLICLAVNNTSNKRINRKFIFLILIASGCLLLGYQVHTLYAPKAAADVLAPLEEITEVWIYREGQSETASKAMTEEDQAEFLALLQKSTIRFAGMDAHQGSAVGVGRYWVYVSRTSTSETTTLVITGENLLFDGSKKYQMEGTGVLDFLKCLETDGT